MSRKSSTETSQPRPPQKPPVLHPQAIAFSAAMLASGLVLGWLLGSKSADSAAGTGADSAASASTAARDNVVNKTGGELRKLSEKEKEELLAKKDKPAANAELKPGDTPFYTDAIVATLSDPVQLADYKRAVEFMQRGNARAARPVLAQLEGPSKGQTWREPLQAMLADAQASSGEVAESRRSIAAFKQEFPKSAYMATVVVAEGKSYMQEAKKGVPRDPKSKSTDLLPAQKSLYSQAISKFDEAIAKWPTDPAVAAAYSSKVALLTELGELDKAEAAALTVAESFPEGKDTPRSLGNVANAAMDKGDYPRAERLYQKLVELFPKDRMAQTARSHLSSLQLLGKQAPELDVEEWLGNDLGGVSALRGKVVMLVFWATWCPHCRREMPHIEETWQKYKDDGLVVVAVTRNSKGQTTGTVREFIGESGLTMPVAIDPGATSRSYGVSGIPAAALIDRGGNVVFRNHPAQITDEMLTKLL
jgi:thiol-disulfide isomerase/thioredoxin